MLIGMDLGSVSLNTVILDGSFRVIYERYTRVKGRPLQRVLEELRDIFKNHDKYDGIAFTGTGGKLFASLLGVNFVNEIIAHARGTSYYHPEVQTILDIGGEDSKIIEISGNGKGKLAIKDFSMNTLCAAGTGSFLDQQASRLGVSVEKEFGVMALMSKSPPRIAGRCSVFAKSDMIHLQQEATPDYDIVAGLCFAMIRNLKGTQGKGRALNRPFSLQGGVAANTGIVRAVKEIFELSEEELIIPVHFASMGAMGGAIHSFEENRISQVDSRIIKILQKGIEVHQNKPSTVLEPLKIIKSERCKSSFAKRSELSEGVVDIHIGVDIGSISTNVAVIDDRGNLLSKSYLMTAGRPIEAVKKGLLEVSDELERLGIRYRVNSAGTTGSGRYLIGEIIGADIVKNEITAQAWAAAEIDPEVDTIFEIGGQDSKFISLEKGVVVDFEMNKVCAAGTGSFLEEQAEKLNISIKEEFGNLSLSSRNPSKLGERCTVFIESDIIAHQQRGAKTDDLVGGLSYSIVYNYLNRVVGDKKVGDNIFFQGGVAFNDGVLAAFENVTGKKITVPPHHEVTGAIGIALIARDEVKKEKSSFVGFDLGKKNINIETFECQDCSNLCEVKKVIVERESPLYFGSRCEKYELREREKKSEIPDLFKERKKLLMRYFKENSPRNAGIKVGIPRALTYFDLFPMYSAFFIELGCEMVLSDKTNKSIIHAGSEVVNAEVCLPIKVAHGHIQSLISKGVDYIFLPSVISMEGYNESFSNNFNCPYVQTIPDLVRAAIDLEGKKIELLSPVLKFQDGIGKIISSMIRIGMKLRCSRSKSRAAIKKALDVQNEFKDAVRSKIDKVEELLESYKPSVVIVSRSYNGFDLGINLDLPRKFKDLGILPIPLDFIPLHEIKLPETWENMYWQYGQKFLKASEYIKNQAGLYAVYVTNFACGPDSFLITYFKKSSVDKPFLQIELDEHSANAGVITRCEAFIDSLKNISCESVLQKQVFTIHVPKTKGEGRTLFIPMMSDHALILEAAFKHVGIDARIMPKSDSGTLLFGRKYTSGKECYPCIITTGDIVKTCMRDDFNPAKSAFFMPSTSGPCRFGQYNRLQQIILGDLGFKDVLFVTPNQDNHKMYKETFMIPTDFFTYGWLGVVALDYFDKLSRKKRPYEINKDETDMVYQEVVKDICSNLGSDRFYRTIEEGIEKFKSIEIDCSFKKPLIGIVGEVFVRSNSFSNNNIIKKIEELGGEVFISPMIEWINYTNYYHVVRAMAKRKYFVSLKSFLRNFFQRKKEIGIASMFRDEIEDWKELHTKEIIKLAEEYISPSFEGEAVLSIGKSKEYMKLGVSGIINTMPFTCMPGTIAASILKKMRTQNNDIPLLNICYDGQEEFNELNRLEAFMYQAYQVRNSRE